MTLNGKPLDNRKGVSVTDENVPDIDWVEIAGGVFIYQRSEEKTLPTFYMSRYPVTYAQYMAFVDAADGYSNSKWWEGLAERQDHPGEQYFKFSNHPAEMVSWYDAIAFCRWLSARLGYEVRLPTEFEWERAARGTDGREYPWGKGYREGYANIIKYGDKGTYALGQTSAVGVYPQGQAPDGVLDMCGNVWEWCASSYDNPAERYEDEVINRIDVLRSGRGGSWGDFHDVAWADYRDSKPPMYRSDFRGLRLCVRFPSPSETCRVLR